MEYGERERKGDNCNELLRWAPLVGGSILLLRAFSSGQSVR